MKEISRKRVFEGFLNLDEIQVETSKGKVVSRLCMERGDAVCAVVYDTKKGKFIFTKQYRQGVRGDLLEIVAGGLKEGEDPIECTKREILEEVGYKTDEIEFIDLTYPSPGGSDERIYSYYVQVSEQTEAGGGLEEEDEEIEIIEMTRSEVLNSKFDDMKTASALRHIGAVKTETRFF